jgi:hypothetical protein
MSEAEGDLHLSLANLAAPLQPEPHTRKSGNSGAVGAPKAPHRISYDEALD